MAIGLFYESGNETRNIHEISAEMSERNENIISTGTATGTSSSYIFDTSRPSAIVLSDNESEDGGAVITPGRAVDYSSQSQSEPEDLIFNSKTTKLNDR